MHGTTPRKIRLYTVLIHGIISLVLIPVRVGSGRLRAAGLPGDDDLVDRQDRPGSLGGELDGPALGDQEIQDTLVAGVQSTRGILVLQHVSWVSRCLSGRKLTSISTPVVQSSLLW